MPSSAPPKIVVTRCMPTTLFSEYASKGKIQLVQWRPPPSSSSSPAKAEEETIDDRIPAPRNWLLENVKGASGLVVVLGDQVDQELLDGAAAAEDGELKLKVVATMSVGYDHVDTRLLKQEGIKLGYTPNILNAAVADLTLLLTLSMLRQIPHASRLARTGQWSACPWSPLSFCGPSLAGKTVGFFGFGAIAQTLCLRLVPFGIKRILFTTSRPKSFDEKSEEFRVLATGDTGEVLPGTSETVKTQPFPHAQIPVQNVPSLHEMAAEADVLFVLASASSKTYHAVDSHVFSRMKPSAVVVNTSRGTLIDTKALAKALKEGKIAGAGLDVLEGEPNIPATHPLLSDESIQDKVLLLPHIGSATLEARQAMADLTAQNVLVGADVWDREGNGMLPSEVAL